MWEVLLMVSNLPFLKINYANVTNCEALEFGKLLKCFLLDAESKDMEL